VVHIKWSDVSRPRFMGIPWLTPGLSPSRIRRSTLLAQNVSKEFLERSYLQLRIKDPLPTDNPSALRAIIAINKRRVVILKPKRTTRVK